MTNSDSWTAAWICEKLISNDKVLEAVPSGDNLIQLTVKEYVPDITVATMSNRRLIMSNMPSSCSKFNIDFLLNIPKDAFIDGDVLDFAASSRFGVGGLGDLYIAINENIFREYIPKEVRFIMRGLQQHSAVNNVIRANSRSYIISRHVAKPLRVLALNEYDLTADTLRSGIEKYGECDFFLASNPNCRLSEAASEAACHAGAGVLMWRQLLGALNSG
ncbi:hypothetical protein [Zhongshania sp.]|jgi:hypothetical protein|uniref:hypothetical protein n=1 Tax=Zhongshania sp. TaxID=1971902 RepID=UPI0039E314C0